MAEPPNQDVPPFVLPDYLVCPLTRAPLTPDASGLFLVTASGIRYPIKDGIPVLLPSAAIKPETPNGTPH